MKNFIKPFVAICILAYLVGCFCNVSFNIKEWDAEGRTLTGILGIVIASIAATAIYSDHENKI